MDTSRCRRRWESPGPDGTGVSTWYPLNSALALPFVAVGRAIANLAKLPVIYVTAPFAILLTILNASPQRLW